MVRHPLRTVLALLVFALTTSALWGCDDSKSACTSADSDGDGVCDADDTCPNDNPNDANDNGICDSAETPACTGADSDGDGVCDADDPCPNDNPDDANDNGTCDSDEVLCTDTDGDDVCDVDDPCPNDNPDDSDNDTICDTDDQCPGSNDLADSDGDGTADACDACPFDDPDDTDGDGVCESDDMCPLDNPDDTDGDGVCDSDDRCPADNPDDSDNDTICDADDQCPGFDDLADGDGDGIADACDTCPEDNPNDSDGDGVCNSNDLCGGAFDSIVLGNPSCPAASCEQILRFRTGAVDGVFSVDPDGSGADFQVYCDMTTDGGGWTLVYNHDVSTASFFANASEARLHNDTDPQSDKYSILERVEGFRADGRFTFKMNWPGQIGTNIWSQSTNPLDDVNVADYVPFQTEVISNYFSGLELSNGAHGPGNSNSSLIDGSVNVSDWHYAIGTFANWGANGIPGATALGGDASVSHVQLWIKPGPTIVCGDTLTVGPWESCDDGNATDGDGCSASCYVESTEPTCEHVLAAGLSTGDGLYLIKPNPSGQPFPAYCDMTTDGGGWTLVMNQDQAGGYFADLGEARLHDFLLPLSNRYSIIDLMARFWRNGHAVFRLDWPGHGHNIWSQTSNPIADVNVQGYRGIDIDAASEGWGGLELGNGAHGPGNAGSSLLDGSVNSGGWWYAVASTTPYASHGIPAATSLWAGASVPHVRLWIRPGAECGDGITTGPDELCDDGNTVDGDGCTSTCRVETGERSCQAILDNSLSRGDGAYTIDPEGDGNARPIYCDMTTDGGGWGLISVVRNDAPAAVIVGGADCVSLDLVEACKGNMTPSSVSDQTEILVRDLGSDDWLIYDGFAGDAGSALRYFSLELVISASGVCSGGGTDHVCGDVSRDPNLSILKTSGYIYNYTAPLLQWWRSGGWWVAADPGSGGDNGRVHASSYDASHGLRNRASASGNSGQQSAGHQALFYR